MGHFIQFKRIHTSGVDQVDVFGDSFGCRDLIHPFQQIPTIPPISRNNSACQWVMDGTKLVAWKGMLAIGIPICPRSKYIAKWTGGINIIKRPNNNQKTNNELQQYIHSCIHHHGDLPYRTSFISSQERDFIQKHKQSTTQPHTQRLHSFDTSLTQQYTLLFLSSVYCFLRILHLS
jgi:hypothetical protein